MLDCHKCRKKFPESAVLFRCPHCSTTSDRPPKGDGSWPAPPADCFTTPGRRRRRATHPACGKETSDRVCRWCFRLLPADGLANVQRIALVGAKGSGKTVYTTVLLNELRHQVGRQFGLSARPEGDEDWEVYSEQYTMLYDDHLLPRTTATWTPDGTNQPLTFAVAPEARHGWRRVSDDVRRRPAPGRWRGGGNRVLLTFFDAAGEDLRTQDGLEKNKPYLAGADAIILLLDPLGIPGATPDVDPLIPRPLNVEEFPGKTLKDITRLLGEDNSGMIDIPIAVTLSKLDLVARGLDGRSPLHAHPPDGGLFDNAHSLEVHRYLRSLLQEWDDGEVDGLLRGRYREYRYFGMTALGASPLHPNNLDTGVVDDPVIPKKIGPAGPMPHRVADPILWLLSLFNTIPTARGRE